MRIAIHFAIGLSILCSTLKAQSLSDLKMTLPSLEERYDMDYHIEGLFNPSADTLTGLNLDQYEVLRAVDEDVYILDPATGFFIQLFSVNKAIQNYTYRYKKESEDTE